MVAYQKANSFLSKVATQNDIDIATKRALKAVDKIIS